MIIKACLRYYYRNGVVFQREEDLSILNGQGYYQIIQFPKDLDDLGGWASNQSYFQSGSVGHFKTAAVFPTPACFDSPLIPQLHKEWSMWSCQPKMPPSAWTWPALAACSARWAGTPPCPEGSKHPAPSHEDCCVCSSKAFPRLLQCVFMVIQLWFPREAGWPGAGWLGATQAPCPQVPTHSPMFRHGGGSRKGCASGSARSPKEVSLLRHQFGCPDPLHVAGADVHRGWAVLGELYDETVRFCSDVPLLKKSLY